MKRKFLTALAITFFATSLSNTTVLANTYASENTNINTNKYEVIPKADIIDYQYKVVNNILYRRLYNYTLNKPVSNWIRVD